MLTDESESDIDDDIGKIVKKRKKKGPKFRPYTKDETPIDTTVMASDKNLMKNNTKELPLPIQINQQTTHPSKNIQLCLSL